MSQGLRTSITDPIHIETLAAGSGQIGVSFCPGKQSRSVGGFDWRRDLAVDLDAVSAWGAVAVISLIEDHEIDALGVSNLASEVSARGMKWIHLPIPDVTAPGAEFEHRWRSAGPHVRGLLASGQSVFIHCKGGLGRAGTVAARLLIELGEAEPKDAIARVREVRRGAIETVSQEDHLHSIWNIYDRARGCLLGLAVGDAVGTTLEFRPRDSYDHITDMVGGGPFGLEPGTWTDDTSMALALADAILASAAQGSVFEPIEAQRRFVDWWRNGAYSPTGDCFDIGITTSQALSRFEATGDPISGSADPYSAGNGSLMRLAPVAIWGIHEDPSIMARVARRQSATTHAAPACLEACDAYSLILRAAILGADFEAALTEAHGEYGPVIAPIIAGSWRGKQRHQISSSGFVAHSLEAALWCVASTDNFDDAVLLAANLGDDADTTAAITGQLAGALYGASSIKKSWLEKLAWRDRIEASARNLAFSTKTLPS
jgi:ADP-ribosyl-[dinitrogen reductase] hydrolase